MPRRRLAELFAEASLASRDVEKERARAARDAGMVREGVGGLASAVPGVLNFGAGLYEKADAAEIEEAEAFAAQNSADRGEKDAAGAFADDEATVAKKIMGRWKPPPPEEEPKSFIDGAIDRLTGASARTARARDLAAGKLAPAIAGNREKDDVKAAAATKTAADRAAEAQKTEAAGRKTLLDEARTALIPAVDADWRDSQAKLGEGFSEDDLPPIGQATTTKIGELLAGRFKSVPQETLEGMAVEISREARTARAKATLEERKVDNDTARAAAATTNANRPRGGRTADPERAALERRKLEAEVLAAEARVNALNVKINGTNVPDDVRKEHSKDFGMVVELTNVKRKWDRLKQKYGGDVVGVINTNLARAKSISDIDDPDMTAFLSSVGKIKASWGKETFGAAISKTDAEQIAQVMPDLTPGARFSDNDTAFEAKLGEQYAAALRKVDSYWQSQSPLIQGGLPDAMRGEGVRQRADALVDAQQPAAPRGLQPDGTVLVRKGGQTLRVKPENLHLAQQDGWYP